MASDVCGLSNFNRVETYGRAELFVMLIGTGSTRSRYELTAHDTQTHALLFDLQIEASLDALLVRSRQASASPDDQAITMALACARRILGALAYRQTSHFRLHIEPEGEILDPSLA
ncbi:MAG TPA: hypothetical protein VJL59_08240 [Anaerolineales bacterium]|nr:hypothetical protein [Anaerolineales bacterium]